MAVPTADVVGITLLTLQVTLAATALGAVLGIPLGAALGLGRFPGRAAVRTILYGLYAFPPIVAGLLLYLAISREGVLGPLGLLFSPTAIVLVETMLTTPLIAGLTIAALADLPRELRDAVTMMGPSRWQLARTLLVEARFGLAAALMVGYGRALAEVAGALVVGGNIQGETRTLGTAILQEVNQGDFEFALWLSAVLLSQAIVVAFVLHRLQRARRPAPGGDGSD